MPPKQAWSPLARSLLRRLRDLRDAPANIRLHPTHGQEGSGGRQYIAVSTGLGGGSPRNVPRLIAPDVRHPTTGNALYVFELPEN